MQYLEDKVTCINWKLYYGRVHGQIHLAAQFTSGVLSHFQNAPWKAGFLVLKGQKMRPPVTPKLKVTEVSQSGFWNIASHPTSVPSFSQIGWPQLLAPGTLSQTMALKCRWFCLRKSILCSKIVDFNSSVFGRDLAMGFLVWLTKTLYFIDVSNSLFISSQNPVTSARINYRLLPVIKLWLLIPR